MEASCPKEEAQPLNNFPMYGRRKFQLSDVWPKHAIKFRINPIKLKFEHDLHSLTCSIAIFYSFVVVVLQVRESQIDISLVPNWICSKVKMIV